MKAWNGVGMTLGLLCALGALYGCGKERSDPYAWVPPVNPPPKPPECPETPELDDIQMADGSYADVRIIDFGEARLYVPTQWLTGQLIDRQMERFDIEAGELRESIVKRQFGKFKPDLHRNECLGIVHVANLDGIPGQFGSKRNTTEFGLWAAENRRNASRDPRFGDDEMNGLTVQSSIMTDGNTMNSPWTNGRSGWSQPHPAFFITMFKGWESLAPEGKDKARAEMKRLGEWLLMPPRDRNEDEVFFKDIRSGRGTADVAAAATE